MARIYFIFILILTIFRVNAQNFISNGDFEHYTQLPEFAGQYYLCTGWNNCGGFGTPDYFNSDGTGPSHLPDNYISTVFPHGGSAVMGISIYDSSFQDFREYLSTSLLNPLTPGLHYQLIFYVTNGTPPFLHGGLGSDHFSVGFSTNPLVQSTPLVISFSAQYVYNGFLFNSNWQQITYDFIADSAYRYITFGCFVNDSEQKVQQYYTATYFPSSYYFLDDISLNLYTGLDEADKEEAIHVYPNPFSDHLYVSPGNSEQLEIVLFDLNLKQVFSESFSGNKTLQTTNLAPGIYFFELLDKAGIRQKGKLVKF
ncbi:MAG: T9SS type A sorting domain-containing protein [Bacteroidetes bacterium]|nr:T9SS type A sorting domain-containing protein [Bacteroidota bacterium]